MQTMQTYTAFRGSELVAEGSMLDVVLGVKKALENNPEHILVFCDSTGSLVDIDTDGTIDEITNALELESNLKVENSKEITSKSPGRPKLGVISKEVTLLPSHWEWLSSQEGGASATLRKLVENARKASVNSDRLRKSREITYRFMHAVAGNFTGYEESLRKLYRNERDDFNKIIDNWPKDVASYIKKLSVDAF